MKVVHNSLKEAATMHEWLHKAKELEESGELTEAAQAYEKVISIDPVHEFAYNRLLIIYRKEKESKKELAAVKKGIKAFEEYYTSAAKLSHGKTVTRISNALMKMTGLADKKGKAIYRPEPIGRWIRRKTLLEKRAKG
ncbi:MAG: YopX family protein [Chitinophagaceae bacterium]